MNTVIYSLPKDQRQNSGKEKSSINDAVKTGRPHDKQANENAK